MIRLGTALKWCWAWTWAQSHGENDWAVHATGILAVSIPSGPVPASTPLLEFHASLLLH